MDMFHRRPDERAIEALLAEMLEEVRVLHHRQGQIMAAQDDINAAAQAVSDLLADMQTRTGSLVSDLTQIQSALQSGQPVDTSALDAAVANAQSVQSALDDAVSGIDQVANPAPAPAPDQPVDGQ